jgi:hypothetical protein
LRTASLYQEDCSRDLYRSSTELLLQAISKNSGIKNLNVDAILPSAAFCEAITGCTSLKKLKVGFCNIEDGNGDFYSLQDQSAIARAIGSHETITSLKLGAHYHGHLYETIVVALQGMSSLRELTLLSDEGCDENFFAAVSTLLSSSLH